MSEFTHKRQTVEKVAKTTRFKGVKLKPRNLYFRVY